MIEVHAGFDKTARFRGVAETELLADAAKPSVLRVAAVFDEKIIDFAEAGGLAEVGGKIFEGMLER